MCKSRGGQLIQAARLSLKKRPVAFRPCFTTGLASNWDLKKSSSAITAGSVAHEGLTGISHKRSAARPENTFTLLQPQKVSLNISNMTVA
jgi:hypothetical protein